jgi:hypothetical protein
MQDGRERSVVAFMHAGPKQERVRGRKQGADQPDTGAHTNGSFEEAGKAVDDEAEPLLSRANRTCRRSWLMGVRTASRY